MSKRVLSLLMALVMLIGLVPATASAASLTTSKEAISVLKLLEGYTEYCYADGSQYSYGYGTACTKDHSNGDKHSISEEKADEALRKELEVIDTAVNNFSASNGLGLSQQKHDALALFSYNCGTAWMKGSGTFKDAVVGGKTGNDFLYAITLWSNFNGEPYDILLNRRLAEANMYLNGVYSKYKPTNYTYVKYDGNGGTASEKVQGYNSTGSVAIKAEAEREGYTFMGWYTAANGGEWVPYLTKSVAGKTLYAHWQSKENAAYSTVKYTMSASSFTSLQPLSKPAADGKAHGPKLTAGATVTIVQDYIDANGSRWCRVADSGWLKVGAMEADSEKNDGAVNVTVTVTNTYINVRKGPSTTKGQIGTVKYGDKLTIVAVETASNGALWGEIEDGGWIALMYTDYDSVVEEGSDKEETPEGVIATAKVVCSSYVNVRAAAGTSNKLVGTLANGTNVDLYSIVTKNGHEWGETAKGWFCLDYATVTYLNSDSDKKDEEKNENGETPIGSGVVVCATTVNVRKGAGVSMPLAGSLKNGAMIKLYDIQDVYNHDWGRINATDWICLDYVDYTLTGVTADKEEEKEETPAYLYSGTVTGVSTELNVYAKASYDAEKIGSYKPGASIKILDVVSGLNKSKAAAVWGKVENSEGKTGWVCMDYVVINPVSYIVISNSLNVRENAGTEHASINKLTNGTVVSISKLAYAESGALWGYSETYGGWMNITSTYMSRANGYTSESDSKDDGSSSGSSSSGNSGSSSTIVGKGIVTGGVAVKVRSGAGTGYAAVTTKNSGSEVTVYETILSGGMNWGRIDEGWVCMAYVYLTSTGISGAGEMGTIANTYSAVNVRSAAGTSNALMGKIFVNSRVEILETKNQGGKLWGRTTLGWVCMDYVLTDADAGVNMDDLLSGNIGGNVSGTTPGEATALSSYKGTVNTATSIYKEAGSSVSVNGVELSKGDAVTLHELYEVVTKTTETKDDGAVVTTSYTSYWARIDEGWIKAEYVDLAAIEQTYTVTCNKLNVRSGAGTHNSDIGDLYIGDVIEVTDLKIVGASIWGYVEDENGWVNTASQYLTLGKVNVNTNTNTGNTNNGTANNTTTGTGTANGTANNTTANNPYGYLYTGTVYGTPAGTVNVRQTPSTGANKTTELKDGAALVVYELAVSENMAWGRCDAGWVSLVYVDLVPYNSTAIDARVVQSTTLNVYASADTSSEVVTSYAKCKVIDIYEVNGHWARTADGWVYTYGTCLS